MQAFPLSLALGHLTGRMIRSHGPLTDGAPGEPLRLTGESYDPRLLLKALRQLALHEPSSGKQTGPSQHALST